MRRQGLVLFFIVFVLCGGESFLAIQVYAWCSGCCMCTYGGGYRSCSGCVPPGVMNPATGQPCPLCAVPDSETIRRSSTPSYNSPSGTRAVREVSPPVARGLDQTDGLFTLMRGGQCMRRSVELRMLGHAGEGLSLSEQNRLEQAGQLQVVAQRTDD